jgi:hypothetical protein
VKGVVSMKHQKNDKHNHSLRHTPPPPAKSQEAPKRFLREVISARASRDTPSDFIYSVHKQSTKNKTKTTIVVVSVVLKIQHWWCLHNNNMTMMTYFKMLLLLLPWQKRQPFEGILALTNLDYSVDSVGTFRSCPPPRFDDFSEKLLGEWMWCNSHVINNKDNNNKDNNNNNHHPVMVMGSVQEVMRSCGGAVQGIREVPGLYPNHHNTNNDNDNGTANDDEEQGFYLNRSNDGFIFFDQDASYSCGSVQYPTVVDKVKNTNSISVSSLSMGKSRLCFVSISNDDNTAERDGSTTFPSSDHYFQLFRKSNWKFEDKNDSCNHATIECKMESSSLPSIVWKRLVQCRMSDTMINQPWMLQRAKWESFTYDDNHTVMNDNIIIQQSEHNIIGSEHLTVWKLIQSSSDMTMLYPQQQQNHHLGNSDDDSTTTIGLSIGAICSRTGYVKSVLRKYSTTNQSLQSVVWLEGRIMGEKG